MIKDSTQPRDRTEMTKIACGDGINVIGRFSGSSHAIMAGFTGAGNSRVINPGYLGESDRVVAVFTCICTGYV
jgi:hypothetical protein